MIDLVREVAPALTHRESMGPRRIWIIDDEPDIMHSLEKYLGRRGFQVDTFLDPESALNAFKPKACKLVICDINMPKLNGFAVYREIRKRDRDVPIWFLTAFEVYRDEFKKVFPGVDVTCLSKSISPSSLADRIGLGLNPGNRNEPEISSHRMRMTKT